MFITPSFKKSLVVEQFQGNYLKTCKNTSSFQQQYKHGILLRLVPSSAGFTLVLIHICKIAVMS